MAGICLFEGHIVPRTGHTVSEFRNAVSKATGWNVHAIDDDGTVFLHSKPDGDLWISVNQEGKVTIGFPES